MTVVFLLPLVLSIVAAITFGLSDDVELPTKVTAFLMAGTAAALQFIPVLAEQVHFLMPLAIQLVLGGWFVIWSQMP